MRSCEYSQIRSKLRELSHLIDLQAIHKNAMQLIQKAEEMIANNHSETDQVRTLAEKVSEKWQKLMYHAQERHKLVMASNNWFKTADQVSAYNKLCNFLAEVRTTGNGFVPPNLNWI